MTPDAYKVLAMAVENGVAYGVMRAFKHDSRPSEDQIAATIEQAVIDEICEWFRFDQEGKE